MGASGKTTLWEPCNCGPPIETPFFCQIFLLLLTRFKTLSTPISLSKGGEHHIYPSRRQKIKPRLEAHALKLDSPSFWKVPQTLNGGALSQSHESDYAEYFLKTAQAFDAIGLRLVLKFKSYVFVLGQASANHFSRFAWIFSPVQTFRFYHT